MPSVSAKQRRFMALCAKNRSKAKGKCPPMKVASEFHAADRATAGDQADALERPRRK